MYCRKSCIPYYPIPIFAPYLISPLIVLGSVVTNSGIPGCLYGIGTLLACSLNSQASTPEEDLTTVQITRELLPVEQSCKISYGEHFNHRG